MATQTALQVHVFERLGVASEPEARSTGTCGLMVLEFDRQLRRALFGAPAEGRAAVQAMESLSRDMEAQFEPVATTRGVCKDI